MVEAIVAASLVLATLLNLGAWHAGLSMPAEVYLGLAVALAGTAWVQGTAGRLALCVAAVMVAVILGSPLTSWDHVSQLNRPGGGDGTLVAGFPGGCGLGVERGVGTVWHVGDDDGHAPARADDTQCPAPLDE